MTLLIHLRDVTSLLHYTPLLHYHHYSEDSISGYEQKFNESLPLSRLSFPFTCLLGQHPRPLRFAVSSERKPRLCHHVSADLRRRGMKHNKCVGRVHADDEHALIHAYQALNMLSTSMNS